MHRIITRTGGAVLALGMTAGVEAAPLSALLGGGSITAGSLVFDQFQLVYQEYSDASLTVDPAQIDVTPLTDGGNDPGPGLRYDVAQSDTLTVTGDGIFAYLNYMFRFRVYDIGGAATIKDNTLRLSSATNFDPTLDLGSSIEEFVGTELRLVETPGDVDLPDLGVKEVELSEMVGSVPIDENFARADFDPQSQLFVSTNILVWAMDFTESAALYQFEQRFSRTPAEAPLPGVLSLFGAGLLGLFARHRS